MAKAPTSTPASTPQPGKDYDPATFEQTELKPEEAPADAKVTPPAEQLNRAGARNVGTSPDPSVDLSDDKVAEATELYNESVANALDEAKKDS